MKKMPKRKRKIFFRKKKNENNIDDPDMYIFHCCVKVTFKNSAIEEKSRKDGVIGFTRSSFVSAPNVHEFRRLAEGEINKIVEEQYYDSLTKKTPEIQSIIFRSVSKLN